jgi:hypothetical protein
VWSWLKDGNLRQLNSQAALSEAKQTMAALTTHIQRDADLLGQHKHHIESLDAQLRSMKSEIDSTRERVNAEAAHESLQSSIAIGRLTQESARHHLHGKSLKNLLKRLLDYRNALRQSRGTRPASLPRKLAALASTTLNHWAPRPRIFACTQVSDGDQATQILKQSCHWPLPFKWCIGAVDQRVLDGVSQTAGRLNLDIHTHMLNAEQAEGLDGCPLPIGANTFIAIPKIVANHPPATPSLFPLPDAELIRQAYNAMHCDPSIAATYVGVPKDFAAAQAQTTGHPMMCLLRSPGATTVPRQSGVFRQHVFFEDVQKEMEAIHHWASSHGKSILFL